MPGSVCSVALCKSNAIISKKKGDQVRFFTFPKDPRLKKEWVRRCFRSEKFDPMNKRICSKHFADDDFEDAMEAKIQNRLPRILKRNCVPSLNLKPEKNLSNAKKARSERAAKRKQKQMIKEIMENQKKENFPQNDISEPSNAVSAWNDMMNKDQNQNIDKGNKPEGFIAYAVRHLGLDKMISEFISSKVQIVVAELLYEDS